MSYTDWPEQPDDTKFTIDNGCLYINFTCPRCEHKTRQKIELSSLPYGIEITCKHPACMDVGERPGYTLTLTCQWESSMLGLTDRPLNDPPFVDLHDWLFNNGHRFIP